MAECRPCPHPPDGRARKGPQGGPDGGVRPPGVQAPPGEIEAKIPYDTDPIAFYKWWRKGKHEHVVYLSPAYQFKLFQKVSVMEPKVMLKKDIEFVKNF